MSKSLGNSPRSILPRHSDSPLTPWAHCHDSVNAPPRCILRLELLKFHALQTQAPTAPASEPSFGAEGTGAEGLSSLTKRGHTKGAHGRTDSTDLLGPRPDSEHRPNLLPMASPP